MRDNLRAAFETSDPMVHATLPSAHLRRRQRRVGDRHLPCGVKNRSLMPDAPLPRTIRFTPAAD